jgi:hypothetical protein
MEKFSPVNFSLADGRTIPKYQQKDYLPSCLHTLLSACGRYRRPCRKILVAVDPCSAIPSNVFHPIPKYRRTRTRSRRLRREGPISAACTHSLPSHPHVSSIHFEPVHPPKSTIRRRTASKAIETVAPRRTYVLFLSPEKMSHQSLLSLSQQSQRAQISRSDERSTFHPPTKCFPSPRCASAIQILRPSQSTADTFPKTFLVIDSGLV